MDLPLGDIIELLHIAVVDKPETFAKAAQHVLAHAGDFRPASTPSITIPLAQADPNTPATLFAWAAGGHGVSFKSPGRYITRELAFSDILYHLGEASATCSAFRLTRHEDPIHEERTRTLDLLRSEAVSRLHRTWAALQELMKRVDLALKEHNVSPETYKDPVLLHSFCST